MLTGAFAQNLQLVAEILVRQVFDRRLIEMARGLQRLTAFLRAAISCLFNSFGGRSDVSEP